MDDGGELMAALWVRLFHYKLEWALPVHCIQLQCRKIKSESDV